MSCIAQKMIARSKSVEVFLGLKCSFLLYREKLTAFLKLECKIIDGTANNHLDELETRDDHCHNLRHSDSGSKKCYSCSNLCFSPHGPECKIGVHQGVDKVVHGHEPPGAGGELAEAVEDIDEHRQVVIPVPQNIS